MNLPFTTHNAMQIDSLCFAFIKDAKGITVARIQADTAEKANEIAQAICKWSQEERAKEGKDEQA